MANKKIEVISKYFSPANAGIEVNITETYKILAKKGWDITVHTSTDTLTESNVLPLTDQILGMNVKRYKFAKLGYFPKLDWDNTDLVCFHNFNVFYFFILAYIGIRKVFGKKNFGVVVTPHGGFNPEWSIYPKLMVLIKKSYHFTIGTFLINNVVDRVRAVSEWERNELIKCNVSPKKVITISNGLEDDAYRDLESLAGSDIKKKVKDLGKYLIQVGRVYVIKNYETVIKSLVDIPNDVKFVIAGGVEGNNSYLESLKTLSRELKVEDRVVFLGVIRGVDKYYLIKNAQMMVHMAIWESFCNVVHEGMSQGLVCIVANNTALPLLIKDGVNGYCVETKDSKTLSEKINFVLENQKNKIIVDMKERNRKFGLEESWTSVANKMDKLYKSLLKAI